MRSNDIKYVKYGEKFFVGRCKWSFHCTAHKFTTQNELMIAVFLLAMSRAMV